MRILQKPSNNKEQEDFILQFSSKDDYKSWLDVLEETERKMAQDGNDTRNLVLVINRIRKYRPDHGDSEISIMLTGKDLAAMASVLWIGCNYWLEYATLLTNINDAMDAMHDPGALQCPFD